jgi:hypothetical protein
MPPLTKKQFIKVIIHFTKELSEEKNKVVKVFLHQGNEPARNL